MVFYEPFYFEFERLVDEPLFSKRRNALADCNGAPCVVRSFKPRLDLHEDSEGNLVTATFEFPGFSKDEIQLDFQNGQLTVSAEAKKSNEKYADGYILRERPYGKFSRTIQLPQGVQDEQIKAAMENGLLTVSFPKNLPELAPKKIAILDV